MPKAQEGKPSAKIILPYLPFLVHFYVVIYVLLSSFCHLSYGHI